MIRWLASAVLFASVASYFSSRANGEEPYAFFHGNVLGTHLELRVDADSISQAQEAERQSLAEIDRLAKVLSSYDNESELKQWLASKGPRKVSVDLQKVLDLSEQWHAKSERAFHPGTELLKTIWARAEQTQQLPSAAELSRATAALQKLGWTWDERHEQVTASDDLPLSFNAIAKGYIIDCVCERISTLEGVHGGLVAIGGDLKVFGTLRRAIPIRSPQPELNTGMLDRVVLENKAIATSSGAFRGFTILGSQYSHLLDPRTGSPASHIASSSVVADTAADADALATVCSVLQPEQALALVDATPGAACMLLDAHGDRHESRLWQSFTSKEVKLVTLQERTEDWNGGMEMKVDFTIHQAGTGGRYRRPYVAVWIEDKDDFPVRTLVLWVQSTGPGPRWIPDLRRWYKSDGLRRLVEDKDLVATVSEATRKPGAYSVVWNGEDDNKKLVAPGTYTLMIESAREHGTYQLIRKKITIGAEPFQEKLEENAEIKAAAVDYRKRKKAN